MRRLVAVVALLALVILPGLVLAQQKVTGKVISSVDKSPLSGATVVVKGTTVATNTAEDGTFSIPAADGQTLSISYTGFASWDVQVNGSSVGTVSLNSQSESFDEVVVVGYATQKKVNLTGAVEVVKGKELVNRPTPTVSQALQGKVSGVNFGTGTYGFEPGAAMSIQVRGQGTPLILVDGIMTSSLNGINPNDIESMSLLKDASAAAIYGARAPYGVLLITTKSGSSDNKLSIDYSGNMTRIKPLNMPRMLDSYTYALALNEAADNTAIAHPYRNEIVDRILAYQADPVNTPATYPASNNPALWGDYFDSNANNDWFKIFYGPGDRQQHNISVNGGNKGVRFFLSGGYVYDRGMLQVGTDNYKRYNFTSKVDANLASWIKVSSNTRFFNTVRNTPAYDNQGNYDLLFHQVARTVPSQAIKSPNGVYRIQSKIPWTKDAGINNNTTNDIVQRFAVEITPMKDWKINADFTVDLTHDAYTSKNYTVYEDNVAGAPVVSGSTTNPSVEKTQALTIYRTLNLYTSYKKSIKNHDFTLLAGYQQEHSDMEYLYARRTGLVTPSVPTLNTSTGIQYSNDDLVTYATEGVFGRLNYNFDDRYLLELNGRYDGTYAFTDGKKWGFFPSASLGWNVSNEGFWDNLKSTISNFKVRASYGSLGNQLGALAYQDVAMLGVNSNLAWIINNARPSYVSAPSLINPAVTWETSNTADIGLDFSILKNKLTFTGDIYERQTVDQLATSTASIPATLGVTNVPQVNNMATKTRGWEISINWNDRIGKDFKYSVAAQMFDYKSTITEYDNATKDLTYNYIGRTVGEIWGFESIGLIQDQATADAINTSKSQAAISGQTWKTGDMQYRDLNKDGVINYGNSTLANPGDRRIIGNSTPRYQFGLTLRAEWKGFDVSMFWQGVGQRDLPLGFSGSNNFMWGFTTNVQSSVFEDHLDYYRDQEASTYSGLGVNTDAFYARPYLNAAMNAKNQVLQTRYLMNGAYARLKNLQIGYNVNEKLLNRAKLKGLYLFVSGENLATISSLPSHFDPETAWVGSRGDGKSFFPSTGFTIGLNVKF